LLQRVELNADPVYSAFRDDPDYAELLSMYVDELVDKPSSFLELGRRSDFQTVRREAHKLKGSAGGYGFHELSILAGRLEESCKSDDPKADIILQEIQELVDYLNRVRV
jgi:HPt (histidine-containing phosphotransfer) domain-containing protein